ncbi:hypothetical protein LWI28_018337 [Acer negundo]|uniref:Ubiquitin-like protease family profile domain-containing protein n=1 Tax=Acer negundo TaxID=4023 RepID=A0AAD5I6P2_ACENE|nr:hypothetical protein LWI28_018337 [Acer negundo]
MQAAENEGATTENKRPTTSLSGGATMENEGATASLSGGATASNEHNAVVDKREQVAGQMENINYKQFLKVKRNKWNEEALINVGCWLKNLATIENIIRKEKKHKEFMSSCFKQFSNFLQNSLFSAMIVHGVLLREITIDGATENELFISLGGKKARFGHREFCLFTGLRFGKLSEIINMSYVANVDDIQKRYWPGPEGEELKLSTVYERFLERNFKQPDDSLKIRLFLIANNVLFGQPLDKKVTNWLFNLVNDLNAFNSFAWGHYVFKMTMHYLRHGFRSRNSNKGHGKVRHRLYGFPWAVEIQVLEELNATDDGARANYWVGVDSDMSVAPQFIPLVEMKDKNELLDTGDDGDDGGYGGEVGEGGDRDDVGDRGTRGQKKKRKAPKQKKKASIKKQQRKTLPITNLAEKDPLPSPYSPGYTPTQHDNPLSVGFTPGYTPTLPHRSSFMQPPPHMSSRQEPRSRDGDRMYELLKAIKALPDLLEGVVKREAPLTDARDPSSYVEQEVDANVSTEQEVGPSGQKEVDDEGLVSGDLRVNYNYGLEEDRLLRIRLRLVYCSFPFIDLTRASATKRAQDKHKYEEFKKKKNSIMRNMGTEESVNKSFFMELEDPKTWLSTDHIDAYMSLLAKRMESDPEEYRHSFVLLSSEFYTKVKVEWNRIIEADNEAGSSFNAVEYECPADWIEYGLGNRPGWGRPWWLYTQLLISCCVGEPDGHWILCKVNLLDHHIGIFDPTAIRKKKNPFERFRQVMPLQRLLPSVMNRCGFFSNGCEKPRGSIFTVGVSSNPKIPQQVDDCSCGVFIYKYAETAVVKKADWS